MRDLIEDLLEATMSVADARSHLGLPVQWTASDLKSAFKKAAFDNHPDRGGSTAKMAAINVAYKVLQKVKPGGGGGTAPDDGWYEAQMEKNGQMVVSTINNLFDPQKYSQYFTKMTGKPFTFTVDDKLKTKGFGGYHYSKKVEWTSGDKETIFVLDLYVNLQGVKSVKALAGEGGTPTLSFSIMVQPTVLHDNRKSKMRQKNWDFSTKQETLVDPASVFPKASIKKMMSGKDKKRQFSKRDAITAMQHRLKATVDHSGGQVWVRIPIGEYFLNMYRTTLLGSAVWDLHSVRAMVNGKWRTIRPDKGNWGSHPEDEGLIEFLKTIQKHTWNDPNALVNTVGHQLRTMYKAKDAKAKGESVIERMSALLT